MSQSVTTYYLAMEHQHDFLPAASPSNLRVERAQLPSPELGRFLYTAVGGRWFWIDRLSWSYHRWHSHLSRPEVELWVAMLGGNLVGYFELEQLAEHQVNIAYFGLLPQFIGRGLGGALLTIAVQRAWQLEANRVLVNTCSLDGPMALSNYQARGFQIYRTTTTEIELPPMPPGPWPGADAVEAA